MESSAWFTSLTACTQVFAMPHHGHEFITLFMLNTHFLLLPQCICPLTNLGISVTLGFDIYESSFQKHPCPNFCVDPFSVPLLEYYGAWLLYDIVRAKSMLKNYPTVLQSAFSSYNSHYPRIRVHGAPHPPQYLMMLVFCNLNILMVMMECLNIIWISIS